MAKLLDEHLFAEGEENLWEQECRKCVFEWACDRVRGGLQDSTWQAFWQTNVEGKDTKEVAAPLGMTVGAVYIARSRILARLKQQIQQVDE